jgi:hypothetical protein
VRAAPTLNCFGLRPNQVENRLLVLALIGTLLAMAVGSGFASASGDLLLEGGRHVVRWVRGPELPAVMPVVDIKDPIAPCSHTATYAVLDIPFRAEAPPQQFVYRAFARTTDGRYFPGEAPIRAGDGHFSSVGAKAERRYMVGVALVPDQEDRGLDRWITDWDAGGNADDGMAALPRGSAIVVQQELERTCRDSRGTPAVDPERAAKPSVGKD